MATSDWSLEKQPTFFVDMLLYGINTPSCLSFVIDKPDFVLGKSSECDGSITFSNEISRNHAKIVWHDGCYYLVDLDSTNKTFVNGQIAIPHVENQIAPGDRITLSSIMFQIEKINR